jgi:polyhydroxyalkanoate synthesis regulator protein
MRALAAAAACIALASCAHATTAPAPLASGNGRIGYVRMDDLVKVHPLYGQLAQYDDSIEALDLRALAPQAIAAAPDLKREAAALNAQLAAAAKRTNDLLQAKGRDYQARENAAIAAALKQAGVPDGPSVNAVRSQLDATAQGQTAGVNAQAQRDLTAYRKQLEAQDLAQIRAAQSALDARADRTFRAKADELTAQEAAYSLKLAGDDAAQRLSLRTRLTSLALDDAQRDAANAQLAALDQKEADALAAMRNTDQQTLAALKAQLGAQIGNEMQAQVAPIRERSLQRYRERERELHEQFATAAGPLVGGAPIAASDPNLSPELRRRILKLHSDYSAAFQTDAKATIADFTKTRADLAQRYAVLTGADSAAAQGARDEVVALQKKRADLYAEMVDQIGREVKTLAQQRGISVVVSDVAAPAGGVDLTDDAMKDIETLHE